MEKCQKKQRKKLPTTTNHYRNHRYRRENFIKKYLNGDGCIIDGFIVDSGHKNGAEVHSITDNGLIIIHNYTTGQLVTKLVARRPQIERYYKDTDRKAPEWLLSLCDWHESLNYNK